jgi:hypothetical protein
VSELNVIAKPDDKIGRPLISTFVGVTPVSR